MGLDVSQPAVLYTSQPLTAAQAGQVYTNLSPSGGAEGISKFKVADVGAYGIQFMSGSTVWGGLWHDSTNEKLHLEFRKRISLVPADGSISGTVIQLGAADGSTGTDIVFVPSQGASSAGATLKNSQTFMLDVDYWSGGARVSGGVLMNAIALDTSGNAALRLAADNLNGSVTTAVTFQPADGSATVPSISFPSNPTRGIWNDTGNEGMRFQNASGTGYMLLFNSGLDLKTGNMNLLANYGQNAASVGVSVGYVNSGLWSNSNTDLRVAANGADCLQVTGTQVNVISGIAFQLGNAAAAAVGVASTHKLRILDSTGTAYDVLAIAA